MPSKNGSKLKSVAIQIKIGQMLQFDLNFMMIKLLLNNLKAYVNLCPILVSKAKDRQIWFKTGYNMGGLLNIQIRIQRTNLVTVMERNKKPKRGIMVFQNNKTQNDNTDIS